jgi:Tfp pilus assembly protein PilF
MNALSIRRFVAPFVVGIACGLLAGCAAVAPPPRGEFLADDRFGPPTEPPDAAAVFRLNDDMRAVIDHDLAAAVRRKGAREALLEAIHDPQQLRLHYDASRTRTAEQTFDARAGNCLSLVVMTAAIAKAMGLPVRYQMVFSDEVWSRSAGIYFLSGHVNLTLGHAISQRRGIDRFGDQITIDFLPSQDAHGQRTREVDEDTVVAMFFNNRAAEALVAGRPDDAYWSAREALRQAPGFLGAYNTLAVVYQRHGDPALAETVLKAVLEREPASPNALANLATLLAQQGRVAEAQALRARLAKVESREPFAVAFDAFDQGMAAFHVGDLTRARDRFLAALRENPDDAEFHYALAATEVRLGDLAAARRQLQLAIETSTRRSDQQLYTAKLERLLSQTTRQ